MIDTTRLITEIQTVKNQKFKSKKLKKNPDLSWSNKNYVDLFMSCGGDINLACKKYDLEETEFSKSEYEAILNEKFGSWDLKH